MSWTVLNAFGFTITEIAFYCHIPFRIDRYSSNLTRIHAYAATYAFFLVNYDRTSNLIPSESVNWAVLNALAHCLQTTGTSNRPGNNLTTLILAFDGLNFFSNLAEHIFSQILHPVHAFWSTTMFLFFANKISTKVHS